ncbi:MAG: FadR/GntR family transcriptional regulator [Christensenellales bacterium]
MLEPLKKTRLYEEIIKQLMELIKNGSLKPGDRLPPERQLAEQLNVSRTAIREALRSLETMGLIESKVGGGTFVKAITLDNIIDPFSAMLMQDKTLIRELIEVRRLLEGEIARLAANRVTDEKVEHISQAIEAMKKDIESGGTGLTGENEFHNALAMASENGAMIKILAMCRELLSKTREATLSIPGQPEKSISDHQAILNAVKCGDGDKAKYLMKVHLNKAIKNLEKLSGPV